MVTGGTDNHLLVVDVTGKGVSGKVAAKALDKAGIVCNFNSIPFDPRKPFDPSGIRIGSPAISSRGVPPSEMPRLAAWIDRVVTSHDNDAALAHIKAEVREFITAFPAPGIDAD
jgi:glycine hydroxymethyltransferase